MTSLGSIALKVLDAPLSSGAPVLAKRKSVVAKVDDAKREIVVRATRGLGDGDDDALRTLSRCHSRWNLP